jgi:2-polyprenyl-3-methyl-5-hydroxy-6-metoxy-1,4-benzoquinol methylase
MSVIPAPNLNPLYYSIQRSDILPLVSHLKGVTTLDVGCGEGATSFMLKQNAIAKRTLGIEYSPGALKKASHVIDDLKSGDVETMDLSGWEQAVDLLLCLDVLEHLYDPWKALKKLSSCIKPGGMIVASIPNVQNKYVVLPLLRGKWQYEEQGFLDRTHIRFFTHRTARALLESTGFAIESELPLMGSKAKLFDTATFGLLRGFLAVQYVFVGRLSPG